MDNLSIVFGSWWTIFCILVASYLALFWWWKQKAHSRFPPGPVGLPIVGVAPFVGSEPHVAFKKWGSKFGPVYSVRLGMRDVVLLNTYEAINQAFVKQSSDFAGRQDFFVYKQVTKDFGVMFSDYSDEFRRQKSFATHALKRHGMSKTNMEKEINREVEHLINKLKKTCGNPVDIVSVLYQSAGNIACSVVMGNRFEDDDPLFLKLLQTLKIIFADKKVADSIAMMMLFPNLRYVPPFSTTNESIVRHLKVLGDIFETFVEQQKSHFNPDDVSNFVEAYIHELRCGAGKRDPSFNEEQLVVLTRDIISAGTETVSTNVAWAIICLLHYPKYNTPIEEEITACFGIDGKPTLSAKDKLPMTCAFLQEVSRFRIPSPLAHHKTTRDVELYGYVIPKGTHVMGNLYGAAWDDATWQHPSVFCPERHLDTEGKLVFSPKIIPFSLGPRFCMGESLARAEVFVLFVSILQHFKIKPAKGLPPLKGCSTNIVYTPQDFEVILSSQT